MAKFKITVIETFSCEYEIDANYYETACEIVENNIASGGIDTTKDYLVLNGSYSCDIF